jgi:hypothetical protein
MIDYFSKFAEVIPIPNQKAETIARTIFTEWISRYGAPHILHSDRGTNIDNSSIITELCKIFDMSKTRTTAYRPQCNGQTERIHRTLNTMLRCFLSDVEEWDTLLPSCLLAYRSTIHASISVTPFELFTGRKMTLPVDIIFPTPDSRCLTNDPNLYLHSLKVNLHELYNKCRKNMAASQDVMRKQTKPCVYEYAVGQLVWLYAPVASAGRLRKKKLAQPWTGPYVIVEKMSPVNFRIRLQSRQKGDVVVVHHDRIKACVMVNVVELRKMLIELWRVSNQCDVKSNKSGHFSA